MNDLLSALAGFFAFGLMFLAYYYGEGRGRNRTLDEVRLRIALEELPSTKEIQRKKDQIDAKLRKTYTHTGTADDVYRRLRGLLPKDGSDRGASPTSSDD